MHINEESLSFIKKQQEDFYFHKQSCNLHPSCKDEISETIHKKYPVMPRKIDTGHFILYQKGK
jgi:hypothetical protein